MKMLTWGPLLGLVCLAIAACTQAGTLEAGGVAPDFRAQDLTGRTIYLNQELKSKPVVLTFFATWCAPCRDEASYLIELQRRRAERVSILCVVVDPENIDKVRSWSQSLSIPYPMLLDEGQAIMEKYRVGSLPATFLIDRNRRILSVFAGFGENEAKALYEMLARMADQP